MIEELLDLRTVTDSLNLRGLSNSNPFSSLYWCEVYDAIRGVMRYDRLSDCFAASIAEHLAYDAWLKARLVSLESLCKIVSSRRVCIAGGSSSLESFIDYINECDSVVAVDGATTILLRNGINPDIVVTDLDGRWSSLLKAAKMGSHLVIHVHGDNYRHVLSFVTNNSCSLSLLFTHQCPGWGCHSGFIPGFTDGERALALTLLCRPRSVILYGMRTWEKVGYWSKPWLKKNTSPWPSKSRKLRIAEFFIRLFMVYGLSRGVKIVRR